jgi:hypothetical protein
MSVRNGTLMEVPMSKPKGAAKDSSLTKTVQRFLRENPEAAKALELFGISNERYQEFVAAQRMPVFYTSNTTNPGGQNGELD